MYYLVDMTTGEVLVESPNPWRIVDGIADSELPYDALKVLTPNGYIESWRFIALH